MLMAGTLQLELVTPFRKLFTVETPWVTIPGAEGELGILPQHVPLLTTIESGVLRWSAEGKEQRAAIHYGYAQVANDRVTVLVEMAERREDLDAARLAAAAERAKKELRGPRDEKGEASRTKKYETKLTRAMVRQSIL